MEKLAQDLFLLTTSLSQLENKDLVIKLFIESLNIISLDMNFRWEEENENGNDRYIMVCTRNKTYGYIIFDENLNSETELFTMIFNATQILAVILERIEHEELLNNQKEQLQLLVDNQTKDLIVSRDEIKSITENSPDIISRFDRNFRFMFTNSKMASMWGIKAEEFVGKTHRELGFPEDLIEFWENKINEAFKNLEIIETYFNYTDEKTLFTYNLRLVPEFNSQGKIISVLSICRDVSEHKQAEERLKISEAKYHDLYTLMRLMSDTMPDLLWAKDLNKQFVFANKAHCQKVLNAVDTKEAIGKTDVFFATRERDLHPENRNWHTFGELCADSDEITLREMKEMQFDEYGYIKGEFVFLDVHKAPMYNNEGKLIGVVGSARDITERKIAEELLLENRKQLADMITFLPDATMAINSEKRVIIWNKAMEVLTGIPAEKMLGKGDYAYSIPFYGELRPQLLDLVFVDEESTSSRYSKITRDGDSFTAEVFCKALYDNKGAWVFAKVSPLYDRVGKIVGAIESVRDITAMKNNDEEKRLKWEQLAHQQKILIETATSDSIANGDVENLSRLLTERVSKYMAVERVSVWLFNNKETVLTCVDLFTLSLNSHQDGFVLREFEFKNEFEALKNNKYVDANEALTDPRTTGYIETYLKPNKIKSILDGVINYSGKTLGVLCLESVDIVHQWTTEEITFVCQLSDQIALSLANRDRNRAENNLRKLSQAVEQSQVSIEITNKDAIIEYVNPKFLAITGYTNDEVVGKNPRILKSGKYTKDDYKGMWELLISGKEWTGIFHNKKKNGELFWESATISPVKNDEGKITHYVAVKEDITAKKEMEIELQKALERAEEMNRLKSNFLANMNHELRTPLNGILGFAGFLSEELNDPKYIEMASTILSSGKRLSDTLNLILDLSNVEAEKIEISCKTLEVVEVIKNISKLFVEAALQKKLDYHIIANEEKIYSELDEQLFQRVIYNLIDNAIKYTAKGTIIVEIGKDQINKKKEFFVKIKDTGIGIPKNKIDIIWDAFRQVSEGLNRGYEGTGLGLTISKKITQIMHGTIEVESELGKGSVFTIKFPEFVEDTENNKLIGSGKISELEPGRRNQFSQRQQSVLYVEDDLTNQKVVKLFLRNHFAIDTAEDALSALKKIEENKYDIILLDINLGIGMNGIQLAKVIRENPNYISVPIVAVTAYTMGIDKAEFIKAGCTHYLTKPFMRNDLLEMLEHINSNY